MSSTNSRESRDRPFPWLCADCFTRTVVPTVMDYTARIKHDAVIHEILVPSLEIPRCQTCGETYGTDGSDEKINDALRAHLRLLNRAQIQQGLGRLGLSHEQLATRLGVPGETVSQWVNGGLIQSKAMDNLLRVYFAFPQVREALRGENQDPQLGALPLEASVP